MNDPYRTPCPGYPEDHELASAVHARRIVFERAWRAMLDDKVMSDLLEVLRLNAQLAAPRQVTSGLEAFRT